ncbi:hypothetical protein PQX77_020601 [Marasmius sp. AFHP31]|nr:hypothetical protein PQX77_020601 [Marasmius sp. AFHP31]
MVSSSHSVGVYNGLIHDITDYIRSSGSLSAPNGEVPPPGDASGDQDFMHPAIIDIFRFNSDNGDIIKQLKNLDIDSAILARQKTCLRDIFTIRKFAMYILLAISIIMISIIGFKFLASINFGSPRAPEDHDKFVICQVPCYTEGDASLRKTVDSLAQLKYDDKQKLLIVICDGVIVGSGNGRPTPRIVLDILRADPNLEPEPLSFVSLGEGAKQHSMGKVGKPNERSRPGNRGRHDSQMVVMHFLNKVHFNTQMNRLKLAMGHQIKNIIGVNPTFYEYLFTVDADTTVDKFFLNCLIAAMIYNKKLLGACGETELANAKQSIITRCKSMSTSFLTTWQKCLNLSLDLLPVFLVVLRSTVFVPPTPTATPHLEPEPSPSRRRSLPHDVALEALPAAQDLLVLEDERLLENELWDKESNHSISFWVPPTKFKNDGYAESHTASIYGRETIYHGQGGPFGVGQERSYSPAPS